jgi:hypothetical protein
MLVDCESLKPLRPDVKAGRSLRKDEQDQEHTQANYHHFDFNLSQPDICTKPHDRNISATRHKYATMSKERFCKAGDGFLF